MGAPGGVGIPGIGAALAPQLGQASAFGSTSAPHLGHFTGPLSTVGGLKHMTDLLSQLPWLRVRRCRAAVVHAGMPAENRYGSSTCPVRFVFDAPDYRSALAGPLCGFPDGSSGKPITRPAIRVIGFPDSLSGKRGSRLRPPLL